MQTEIKEEQFRRWLLPEVDKGTEVVVTSGRKVPKGTRGVVRWIGDASYGMRVGIAVPDQDKLSYTDLKNVTAVYPGLNVGDVPCGGWKWLYLLHQGDRHLPQNGHTVRSRKTGEQGKVFWIGGSRIGFKTGLPAQPVWAAACEVEHLCTVPNEMFGTVDEWVAYEPYRIAAVPQRDPDEWEKALANHPPPFRDIRRFKFSEEHPRGWTAFDADGNIVCTLTDQGVRQLASGR
tara:strand:+ start:113 stop:811 length:699 start_codon:yes stop_codon:yes gene_type:complete